MRDIVAETPLKNQASLYHHFENKRALYEAVLKRGLEHITSLVPGDRTDSLTVSRVLPRVIRPATATSKGAR